jgi:uncharacterized protein (DUF849 family)
MLPLRLAEIVETARLCHMAGANGLHLHIRDRDGRHSLDAGAYLEALAELKRTVPGMDIQVTTEAAGLFDVAAQLNCLKAVRPVWASISVREIARNPELAPKVYATCADQGTRVQHILYDAEDAKMLNMWQANGWVRDSQTDQLLVLGRYSFDQQSVPADLGLFPDRPGSWMVCAFGNKEHECLQAAAARGGDVRVGFENSLTNEDGLNWADNAASVAALVGALKGIDP